MTLGTQHYLVYIILLKWLELKIILVCYKLRAKLRFYGFLSFFCTFAYKEDQTWFILHETWHTKIFDINYCVEVVGIENHSHMQEITY